MCVDHDARLPALPGGPHTVTSQRVILEVEDGNRFDAFSVTPDDTPETSSILVLPDVRGIFGFYEDLTCQFAAWGHPAVAIDYFGRTAGTGPRPGDFPFMDHVALTDSKGLNADIASAVDHLRARAPDNEIYTVGFCFGGTLSWAAATHGHGLAGAVGFYGKPDADRPAGDGPIWNRCHLMEGKLLALMGGDDPSIPSGNIARFTSALEDAGVDHQVVTYPGAPHSFFDRSQAAHQEESLDAWNRMMAFIS